jgi:hypothetical protein
MPADRDLLLRLTSVFEKHASNGDEVLVGALMEEGVTRIDAEKIAAFLPMAFARVILRRLGAKPSSTISAKTRDGLWIEVALAEQPIFVEAEALAADAFSTGAVPRGLYLAIAARSGELNAANNALNEGVDIRGSSIHAALCTGLLGERIFLELCSRGGHECRGSRRPG